MINWFASTLAAQASSNPSEGDIFPATSSNASLTEFEGFSHGIFYSWGETSFMASDSYVTNQQNDPPPPSTFVWGSNIDSASWATAAKNMGAKYAVLTTGHHVGFNNFPYTGTYNGGNTETTFDSDRGALTVPVYQTYDVSANPSSDQNVIGKFLDQCAVEGIKGGLYYNIGKNINMRRGLDLLDASYDQGGTYSTTYSNYNDFVVDEVTHIATTYTPDIMWLDAGHHYPRYVGNTTSGRRYIQDVYNAIKTASPNTLIIMNYDCPQTPGRDVIGNGTDSARPPFSFDGTEMVIFPSDIISFEAFRTPDNSSDFLPITSHSGTNYYTPRELITTDRSNGQYFSRNDNLQPLIALSTHQGKVDLAKANGVPFLSNIAILQDGTIPQESIDRINALDFT